MSRDSVRDADCNDCYGDNETEHGTREAVAKIWGATVAYSTLLSLLLSSFLAAFDSSHISLLSLLYICDVIYLTETVNRIVAYSATASQLNSNRRTRFKLRLALAIDFISLMPFEVFAIGRTSKHSWIHATRLHRLNRAARFYKLYSFFGHLEEKLGSTIHLIRTFKNSCVAYAILHLMACGWYVLACDNKGAVDAICYEGSWSTEVEHGNHPQKLPIDDDVMGMNPIDVYLICLYWAAMTATSTGYGDIHAVTYPEKWYSIFCMLVGIFFFYGAILGYIGSSLTNSDGKRANFKLKLDAVLDHLRQKNIRKDLTDVVSGFYEHMWSTNSAVGGEDLLNGLPMTIQAELSRNVNRHVLEKVPLFKDTCNGFKRMLSPYIKSNIYYPGQLLFRENDIGNSLYYIRRGEVQIFKGDDEKPIRRFKEGSYFGEISVVLNVPRTATARATVYCDILSLDKSDLTGVLRHFPKDHAILNTVIEERYEQAELNRNEQGLSNVADVENLQESSNKRPRLFRINFLKVFDEMIVLPLSPLYLKWRFLIFCITLAFIIVHTSIASFEVAFDRRGYGDSVFLQCVYGFWYLYDILLFLDILLGLRTAIEHPEKGGLVKDPKQITKIRLRTVRFWLDVSSVLPIELFAFCVSPQERWYAATFLKSNRLIRIYHIPQYFRSLEKNIHSNISRIRAFMLFLYIFLITHLTSCVWFVQACFGSRCRNKSWASKIGIDGNNSMIHYYLITLYWSSATMTSTGYGDISAYSRGDVVVVLFVLLIGLLLYGYCVTCIAATLNNLVAPKIRFANHISGVIKFLKDFNVSLELRSQVENYLTIVWRTHKGQSLPGAASLMRDMPLSLQQDVSYEEMKAILQDVPIFRDTDEMFQKMVSLCAKSYLFTPGDIIVTIGDICRDLYIVRRGIAEILSADKSCVVATFGPGGYFGEVALLYGESRPSDVRAKTYCEVVVVSKAHLDQILLQFPVIGKQLQHISNNIEILKKIQATAHEEANRSVTRNATQNGNKKTGKGEKQVDSHDPHWNISRLNPLSKGSMRRISLPKRLEGFMADRRMTPEFRQERISIIERQEQEEYYSKLNPIVKLISKLLLKRSISPESSLFQTWILLSVIISYVYLVLIGFQVSFTPYNQAMLVICYIFDVFFLIDMYLKMHVGYYNKNGILVTCPLRTAEEYLRTNFILDVLALIPFQLFIDGYHGNEHFGRANRLLHLVKIIQFSSFFNSSIRLDSNIIKHISLCSYLLLITHYFACAWFHVACPNIREHRHPYSEDENPTFSDPGISAKPLDFHHSHFKCGEKTWVGRMHRIIIPHEKLGNQYIVSLYWAISTLCSVGYGDIHAYLSSEMILSCVCMVFGVVYFGYIIASALACMPKADVIRAKYQNEIEAIKLFIKNEDVETSLARRVLSHYEYLWKRRKNTVVENTFQGLPTSMQGNICLSLYQSFLLSIPLFKESEPGFIKLLSSCIKPMYILKGEYIVKKGDLCQEIIFIHRGTAEIVTDDEKPMALRQIGAGHFFGDVGVGCNSPVYSSIRAQTHVHLFVLTKEDLEESLNIFPQIKQIIISTAQEQKRIIDAKNEQGVIGCEIHKVEKHLEDQRSVLLKKDADVNGSTTEDILIEGQHKGSASSNGIFQWNRFVIDINSPLKYIERINCVGIFFTYITITYIAAYQQHFTLLLVFNYIWEASFLFEMYLNFHMAYTSENDEVVNDFDQIWRHYLNGRFKMDLISNFPFDFFAFAFPVGVRLRMLSFFRLIHVLRTRRILNLYERWATKLNINILIVKLYDNGVKVSLATHTFGCIWYMLACDGDHCSEDTWKANVANDHDHRQPLECYNDCIYWAVATMTSTGYGDIHATNAHEMLYASFVMLAGKLISGFVLGDLTSALASTEIHRVKYEEKLEAIQAHMRGQNVSLVLQNRVLAFFRYSWTKTRGVDVSSLLNQMPYCLRAELYVSLIGETLRKVPMFLNCSQAFLRLLCSKAQYCQFSPGEFVMRSDDVGQCLYLVKKGEVEGCVTQNVGNQETIVRRMTFGNESFFGEGNILSNQPCNMTIKTITDVDLFAFTKSAIESVLHSFEEEAKYFDHYTSHVRRLSIIKEESNIDL